MIETNNSPLPIGGDYFTNAPDFDPQVFFTDPSNTLFYLVFDVLNNYKVIYNGKLNGYDNNYRVSLSKYIKFKDNPINFTDVEGVDFARQYTETLNNSDIIVVFDVNNLLITQPSKFIYNADGSIYCDGSPYSQFTTSTKRNYRFYDKSTVQNNKVGLSSVIYTDSWIPMTLFNYSNNSNYTRADIFDSQLSTIKSLFFEFDANKIQYGLIKIPSNGAYVEAYDAENSSFYNIYQMPCNTKQWFYYNSDGFLMTFYSEANIHKVENTEKEYIIIGNKQITTKAHTTKQYKINIGFKLSESEVYEIVKTPYIYELIEDIPNQQVNLKRYKNTMATFEGYIGLNFGERNMEIIIEDEKKYKKITTPSIGFFD